MITSTNMINRKKQRGATMIEILVTIVILAIGLLGVVAMQVLSLKNANVSHQHYQAALTAQDMAERIRSNKAAARTGLFDDVTYDDAPSDPGCSPCTAAEMADMDIAQWKQELVDALPNGRGSIEKIELLNADYFSAPGDEVAKYQINLTWDEMDGSRGGGETKTMDYSMQIFVMF